MVAAGEEVLGRDRRGGLGDQGEAGVGELEEELQCRAELERPCGDEMSVAIAVGQP